MVSGDRLGQTLSHPRSNLPFSLALSLHRGDCPDDSSEDVGEIPVWTDVGHAESILRPVQIEVRSYDAVGGLDEDRHILDDLRLVGAEGGSQKFRR